MPNKSGTNINTSVSFRGVQGSSFLFLLAQIWHRRHSIPLLIVHQSNLYPDSAVLDSSGRNADLYWFSVAHRLHSQAGGRSPGGRALPSHGRGHRFNPVAPTTVFKDLDKFLTLCLDDLRFRWVFPNGTASSWSCLIAHERPWCHRCTAVCAYMWRLDGVGR